MLYVILLVIISYYSEVLASLDSPLPSGSSSGSSSGSAKIYTYKQKEVLKWATKIAERYMGRRNAEAYDKRNSGGGAVLVQINPTRIIAEKDIAAWD